MSNAAIKVSLREYILQEFLPGEDPSNLQDATPLIASGILDSLATMRLVGFLEEAYSIDGPPPRLRSESHTTNRSNAA